MLCRCADSAEVPGSCHSVPLPPRPHEGTLHGPKDFHYGMNDFSAIRPRLDRTHQFVYIRLVAVGQWGVTPKLFSTRGSHSTNTKVHAVHFNKDVSHHLNNNQLASKVCLDIWFCLIWRPVKQGFYKVGTNTVNFASHVTCIFFSHWPLFYFVLHSRR